MCGVCLAGDGGEVPALARKRAAVGQQNSLRLHLPPRLHLFLKFSSHISFSLPGGKKKKINLPSESLNFRARTFFMFE